MSWTWQQPDAPWSHVLVSKRPFCSALRITLVSTNHLGSMQCHSKACRGHLSAAGAHLTFETQRVSTSVLSISNIQRQSLSCGAAVHAQTDVSAVAAQAWRRAPCWRGCAAALLYHWLRASCSKTQRLWLLLLFSQVLPSHSTTSSLIDAVIALQRYLHCRSPV